MILKKEFIISILFHVAIILAMIIKIRFFEPESIDISRAIRVDMVGMPEKIITKSNPPVEVAAPEKPVEKPVETKPPQPEPVTSKTEPKVDVDAIKLEKQNKKNEINKNEIKSAQKAAIEKLKKLSAIEKIKQQLEAEKNKKNKIQNHENSQNQSSEIETEKPVFKGKVLSKGTALTGVDKLQSNEYLSLIDEKIKSNWQLPQWLINKPLKAKVLLKIDPTGQILSSKIIQTSGQPTYDNYCLEAVQKSAPFPTVPTKFTEVFKEDGLHIGFPE